MMNLRKMVWIALVLLQSAAGLTGGEVVIQGTVQLPQKRAGPSASARYQGGTTEPVAAPEPPTAVVYLEGDFPVPAGAPPVVRLGQKGFQFEQALLPIRTGTRVEFPNRDDAYHNVFSYSKPKRFDLGRYRKDEKPASQVFDQPGVVKLYCEIHAHMRAVILVLDTPHYVKTDPAGRYRMVLPDVPPGRYKLKAWVGEEVTRESTVEIKDGGQLTVDFPG